MKCETSVHIDTQPRTVKAEPLVGHLDNKSLEEHSPTYLQLDVSERVSDIESQRGSVTAECLLTSSPNRDHSGILDTTFQEIIVSNGLETFSLENQESHGLGATLEDYEENSGKNNQFNTSKIKSRIIGQKRVHCNLESHTGSFSTPMLAVVVKNELIEDTHNGSLEDFNSSRSLSSSCQFATPLISSASTHSNESMSSRRYSYSESPDVVDPFRLSASTSNLPTLDKEGFISKTSLAILSEKPEACGGFADAILHTAENLSSSKLWSYTGKVKTETLEPAIEASEENSSELSTSIRKAKSGTFQPAAETFEGSVSETPSFIWKVKSEPYEPAIPPSEIGISNVSHLDMLRSDVKVEEANKYPFDVIDHISLQDRSNMVRQAYPFCHDTAENVNSSKFPPFIIEAKTEPFEPTLGTYENMQHNIFDVDVAMADVKVEKIHEFSLDMIDHISFKDRLNMLLNRHNFSNKDPMVSKDTQIKDAPIACPATTGATYSARRRKRKKTATDSVEEALGEDAPELLQVLVDQGINIEEIKLYEVMDGNDDLIDVSDVEDNFTDLGHVLSKIFLEKSNSLLKPNSLHDMKGSKAAYSLACLISLIQQVLYLQQRKCPVEWGWCRDLQSFIFVFEKHNRIVLERPEYGYATYFFELVESLPIDWQVKRLVIAMKLINCSRIAIIENKSLMVGQNLSEGEARVLQDYGWKPATGLASMLNFCDRVVHDRRTELSLSEWKSKIGKLLMNGYDGGRIVTKVLPKKVMQYIEKQNSSFKVEMGTVDIFPDETQR